ncbi:major pollen allergen Ole e 10 isoform X1 [Setaria viridis]|uniref:major pollen allergen Ole e 10 isoform X1 n=1 Tax=Setaria viridis TaxID=4556 RepID=UPI00149329A9|nr:major pollen allergen Ole e 10-like isoform X1 [Setaria viridis]
MASSNVTLLAFCVALTLSLLCNDASASAEAVAQPLRQSHRKVGKSSPDDLKHLNQHDLPFLLLPASQASKTWCVAKPSSEVAALQDNLDFACSESDCGAIQGTGGCTRPDSLLSRASVAMNAYYQARGRNSWNCFFNGTGLITITDPSLGTCKYA